MGRARWALALSGVIACSAPERTAGIAPPISATAPVEAGHAATTNDAAPAVDAAPVLEDEPPISPIAPPAWSEAEMRLMRATARAPHVVRGIVAEAGERRWVHGGVSVTTPFAVVTIAEWIVGRDADVLPKFRRSFPLFGTPMAVGTSKSPSSDSLDPMLSLITRKGQQRLFFVRLPTDDYRSSVSWGPPPDLRARFGEDVVGYVEDLPVDDVDAARAASENLAKERAWAAANAERVVVRNRFTDRAREAARAGPIDGAAVDRVAEATAAETVASLAAALGRPVSRTPAQRNEKDGTVTHVLGLRVDGDATLDSTLTLRHVAATAALLELRVSRPLAARIAAGGGAPPKDELVALVKKTHAVRFDGGRIDADVSFPTRDGAELVQVRFQPAERIGHGRVKGARTLELRLARPSLTLLEYQDDWAKPAR